MRKYALAIADRAVRTGAQAMLLVFGADQIDALNADWELAFGFGLGGVALSVLTSLITGGITGNGPSLTTERVE